MEVEIMLKAWETYYSKTLEDDVVVVDDDRLHDEMNKAVTVKVVKTGFFTILFKSDLIKK